MTTIRGHSDELRQIFGELSLLYGVGEKLKASLSQADQLHIFNAQFSQWKEDVNQAVLKASKYDPSAISTLNSYLSQANTQINPLDGQPHTFNEISFRLSALASIGLPIQKVIDDNTAKLAQEQNKIDDGKINFNEAKSIIYLGSTIELSVRRKSIPHCICKLVFENRGSWVEDTAIIDELDNLIPDGGPADVTKPVYDSLRKLNKRIKKDFKVNDFFEYDNRRIRISPKYL
jgi:hypothetical protein